MSDKRRYRRFIVEGMDIHGKIMFSSRVDVLNVSLGGISIITDKRLNIGSEYSLKLEDKEFDISLKGIVIWSEISGSRKGVHGEVTPLYKAGMKFEDILSEKVAKLIDFIESHTPNKEHRLTGVRFNVEAPENAILHYPHSYSVKKISLSGMLIETIEKLPIERAFPMELILPEEPESIKFLGRVASVHDVKDQSPMRYEIGIEFLNMSDRDKDRLKQFLQMFYQMDDIPLEF